MLQDAQVSSVRLTRPALYLVPALFSSFPALVMLEALPGGVPKRSASRMPVELGRDSSSSQQGAGGAASCYHPETCTFTLVTRLTHP